MNTVQMIAIATALDNYILEVRCNENKYTASRIGGDKLGYVNTCEDACAAFLNSLHHHGFTITKI